MIGALSHKSAEGKTSMDDAPQPKKKADTDTAKMPASPREERKRRENIAQPAAGEEIAGPEGPEPTRYGDWERKGRCIDF